MQKILNSDIFSKTSHTKSEVIKMSNQNETFTNVLKKDPEMSLYFDTLPRSVQETMIQSGVKISNLEELKQCAKNWLK